MRADAGLVLHSVTGVFQETFSGREPILPAHLASGDPSYDLDQVDDELDAFDPHLVLRLPAAFTAPRLISVEARWHQPGFDNAAVDAAFFADQPRVSFRIDVEQLTEYT